jgi:hypothetical protein
MGKKTSQEKNIEIKLLNIKESHVFIDSDVLTSPDFKIEETKIEIGFKSDFKADNNIFILHLSVIYKISDTKIVEITTASTFNVKALKKVISIEEDNKFQDKSGLVPTLLGIAIGTMRGILFAKTVGTKLSEYPLPLINPTDLCEHFKEKE